MDRRWWIVISGSVAHAVCAGLSHFGMGAYFPSLEKEFGWSRTAISGAFSFARVESGILGPLEGYLTERLGPGKMMFIGIFLGVLGFLCFSQVNSLPMLYAVFIFGIVLGSSLGYNMPISLVIAQLFRKKLGLAFGIFRMGPGLSGALVPLVGWMIGLWGWRFAATASAILLLGLSLPLAFVITRSYARHKSFPADLPESNTRNSSEVYESSKTHFTLREAISTRSFWMLTVGMALRHMVTEGVSVHFVILLVDRGWSTGAASGLLGISTLIGAPARLGMGWLGDLFDKRRLIMWILFALGVSVMIMGWTADPYIFMVFMVIYSLAYGGLATLQEPIRADYFGTEHFASIFGMTRTITTFGSFLGPICAGFFYDTTKSYAIPFAIFAFISFLAMLCIFMARPPLKRPV